MAMAVAPPLLHTPPFPSPAKSLSYPFQRLPSKPTCLSTPPPPRLPPSRDVSASVAFNPSGNFELPLFEDPEKVIRTPPPLPPTAGRFEIVLDNHSIRRLDLSPLTPALPYLASLDQADDGDGQVNVKELLDRSVGFSINYDREDPNDLRELSEMPDIRLWFVRLDACYPWFPVVLDWRAGELARYAAMLVPHQMSSRLGVVFNPEALELFTMNKVFIVHSWLKQHKVPKPELKAKDMARMLGFGVGDELFDLIDPNNIPSLTSSE